MVSHTYSCVRWLWLIAIDDQASKAFIPWLPTTTPGAKIFGESFHSRSTEGETKYQSPRRDKRRLCASNKKRLASIKIQAAHLPNLTFQCPWTDLKVIMLTLKICEWIEKLEPKTGNNTFNSQSISTNSYQMFTTPLDFEWFFLFSFECLSIMRRPYLQHARHFNEPKLRWCFRPHSILRY